jgi:O-antigen/teichoic acid export membrane protein
MALGKPKLLFWVGLVKLAAMVLCIVPLTARYGYLGTSIAVTISAAVVESVLVPVTARSLDIPILGVVKPLAKPMLSTLLMLLVLWACRRFFVWHRNVVSLFSLTGIGLLVYAGLVLPTERALLQKLKASLFGGTTSPPDGFASERLLE